MYEISIERFFILKTHTNDHKNLTSKLSGMKIACVWKQSFFRNKVIFRLSLTSRDLCDVISSK